MSTVKTDIDPVAGRVHLEVTRGTPTQASEYCKDPAKRHPDYRDFLFEKGTLPDALAHQGARNDIIRIKKAIDEGAHPDDLAKQDENFGAIARGHKFFAHYYDATVAPRDSAPLVMVLYGDSGCGKSGAALLLPRTYFVPLGSSGTSWFNGYDPRKHDTVVFNEFGGSTMRLSELLQTLDATPILMNIKGGYCQFRPKMVVLTSNVDPKSWYNWENCAHPFEALDRRLTHIWRYEKKPLWAPAEDNAYAYAVCERGNPDFHPMVKRRVMTRLFLDGKGPDAPLFRIAQDDQFQPKRAAEDMALI